MIIIWLEKEEKNIKLEVIKHIEKVILPLLNLMREQKEEKIRNKLII